MCLSKALKLSLGNMSPDSEEEHTAVTDLCDATAAAALEDPYHQDYVSVMSDEMLDDHLQDEHGWVNGNV
jgi:hypothetical protein